jgi:hypothetical protein
MAGDELPKWFAEHVPAEVAQGEIFRFDITLRNGHVISIDLLQDIDIDFDILEEQHERVAAQYVFWATIYSEVRASVATLELKLRAKRTAIARMLSAKFKQENQKLTDKQFTAVIDGDPDLIRLEATLAIAQRNCGKVYHMVQAISMRSEHCRSLAGFKRQEKEQSGRQI